METYSLTIILISFVRGFRNLIFACFLYIMPKVKLLDGGFYDQLSKITKENLDGHPLRASRFLKYNEEACIQAHRDTLKAGADILKTVTYEASIAGLQKYLNLCEEESINLVKRSVDLIRKAIELECLDSAEGKHQKEIQICGSVGSYGSFLHDGSEYRGEYVDTVSHDLIKEWHRPRILALVEAGVDIIAFETIPALIEAELLLNLIKEFPSVKVWVSFSCKDDKHTSHGEQFSIAAKRCWEVNSNQLLAVGVNCLHPRLVIPLLKPVRDEAPYIPLICYPNTEDRFEFQMRKWLGKGQDNPLVNYLDSFLDLGIEYVGGCCQTNLQDLCEFQQHLESRRKFKNDV